VLFTALENCLLDPRTDSCSAAEEAIAELERRLIPWVIFSGRTRAQLEPLRRKIGHRHPFVTENGGGLFLPQDYFNISVEGSRRAGGYQMVAVGTPYAQTCAALEEIAGEAGIQVASVAQMKLQETVQNLGLSTDEAHRARQREFEEQFFIAGASEKQTARFVELARQRGFTAQAGEPLWRFSGVPDAGRAARQLVKLYRAATRGRFQVVAIGSSELDLSMLAAANKQYMLERPRKYRHEEPNPKSAQIEYGGAAGAANWAKQVLRVLEV
jgi:mannosyl-3-phosphoglycerate phosphatase